MAYRDFNNLGRDLNRIIEDAIHMRSFGHLNDTINRTVRSAFQAFDSQDENSAGSWEFNLSGEKPGKNADKAWNGASEFKQSFEQSRAKSASVRYSPGGDASAKTVFAKGVKEKGNFAYFAGKGKRYGGAIGMMIGGIILMVLSLGPLGAGALGAMAELHTAGAVFFVLFGAMAVGGCVMTVKGNTTRKLAARFDRYVGCMGGRTYADIKELASYTHNSEALVVKDVKRMLAKGWFLQGHLDDQDKCLIISHEAYGQYLKALEGAKQQAEEARMKQEAEGKRGKGLTPEAKAIIDRGHEYIKQIRAGNDAIPGEEVSEKIYRMELLVKRIFQQAEAHPENVSDLRKLMEYYLPMTVKLLKAYEELDRQPVHGENIISSKKEIEGTLDTLNAAFEKLLDNLFQDTAWDVSSDISVLEAMLAQEGLMKDGLSK